MPTKSALPSHPFSVLDNAPELAQLFAKYPTLRQRLNEIHKRTLPPPGGGLLPARSGARRGLGGAAEAWSPDIGLRRAQKALRRARGAPGRDGEGVREYCDLVLHLLARRADKEAAHAVVRREVQRDETDLVRRLLDRERELAR
jgi:zinc finger HIT domain-containing protein 3